MHHPLARPSNPCLVIQSYDSILPPKGRAGKACAIAEQNMQAVPYGEPEDADAESAIGA